MIKRIIEFVTLFFQNRIGGKQTVSELPLDRVIERQRIINKEPRAGGVIHRNFDRDFKVMDITEELARHKTKKWKVRDTALVDRVVFHQSMSDGDVEGVNRYHIEPGNHISKTGCPRICYHYVISRDGIFYKCNKESCLTWHTRGQNLRGIGVLVMGDFSGGDYMGPMSVTEAQVETLTNCLFYFTDNPNLPGITNLKQFYGHCDFGKPHCPGTEIYELIHTA